VTHLDHSLDIRADAGPDSCHRGDAEPGQAPSSRDITVHEGRRLAALRGLCILDTDPEPHFDAVCRTAQSLFDVPVTWISLVDSDRQWFKARCGFSKPSTARDTSFCDRTICSDEVLVVRDAARDPRFRDNALVTGEPGIRFYAGAPLILAPGLRVGTLCLIDKRPRLFTSRQRRQLQDLAAIVVGHLRQYEARVASEAEAILRRESEARLAHMARFDALTGLANRASFHESLAASLPTSREAAPCAVLLLDLDRFKSVNDTLGHRAGDELLQEFAARISAQLRPGDLAVRLGGDEFAILLHGPDGNGVAETLARRLIDCMRQPVRLGERTVAVGLSVGIAYAPRHGSDPDRLLGRADLALYRAKREGRNTYRIFEPTMDEGVERRRKLELDLETALRRGEFELHYQPIVRAQDHRPVVVETLVRWRHPEDGYISPACFIPAAEETGLIVPLGEWVLRTAARDAHQLPPDVRVAVNVSAVQIRCTNLAELVRTVLEDTGLSPHRLELEITESVLMQDEAHIRDLLKALRRSGIRLALDDFGSGYSSLSYLRSFPFDKIKIDRSFAAGIEDPSMVAIIRAVVDLGRALGMTVTAEGVETPEQLKALASEGCDQLQGYLLAPPTPLANVRSILASPIRPFIR
jgi:diguanylate cyclase (GGDEF)-like protein